MLEWEEGDRSSFEDSERFEEDSLCSWQSEPELCNNWRGWKKNNPPSHVAQREKDGSITTLVGLCARTVAAHIPFEVVEQMMPVVPEQIQKWIAFWSFPDSEDDIRLYSCLANGNSEEFNKGENLYKNDCVHDVLQIGFHLSATVSMPDSKGKFEVAVTFDRGRITTCNCTCNPNVSWCSHVVSVCLHRIHKPHMARLRAPVSESLSRLQREQLQKFAQYLISELPKQFLPTAQRLIEEILSSQSSDINTVSGAPDPTAGASANERIAWWLDEGNLHESIRKILVKFCVPTPTVYSDVHYLSSTAPPVASEWQSLLRPLRGREPEGMWNLIQIVREMFKRHDHNAISLLEIITEECLIVDKIIVWWVQTRVALHTGASSHGGKNNMNSSSHGNQYACSSLCDEVVTLWRLASLNPALSPSEREFLKKKFKGWHLRVLEKYTKSKEGSTSSSSNNNNNASVSRRADVDIFPGFKPAIEACFLDWRDYTLQGITYSPSASHYYCPVICSYSDTRIEMHTTVSAALSPVQVSNSKRPNHRKRLDDSWNPQVDFLTNQRSRQRSSSVSSEGFCDSDSPQEQPSPGDVDSGQVSRQNSREDYNFHFSERCHNVSGRSREWVYENADFQLLQDPGPSDEYGIYVYNPQLVSELSLSSAQVSQDKVGDVDMFTGIKKLEDPMEILFARAEGLHAHGHIQEAIQLAVKLAHELLMNPPNLMVELPVQMPRGKRKKVNPASHQLTCRASLTLAKCAFLCTVLAEDSAHHHLAFKVALFGLEMARPPASTKPMEVKLANQESELVSLLKKLPLGKDELMVIREKAGQIRSGNIKSRGEALLPLMLASYIFDALVVSRSSQNTLVETYRLPSDELLGFEEAVAALGLKANVCEADHPLLCEGTRRQRGDLALTLLTYYKDDQKRLAIIMDKFLDKDIHQMYKAPSLSKYYSNNTVNYCSLSGSELQETSHVTDAEVPVSFIKLSEDVPFSAPCTFSNSLTHSQSSPQIHSPGNLPVSLFSSQTSTAAVSELEDVVARLNLSPTQPIGGTPASKFCDQDEMASAVGASSEVTEGECSNKGTSWVDHYNAWQENLASSSSKRRKKKGQSSFGTKRGWVKPSGPGSDSGSSGNSSDSIGSFSSGDKGGPEILKPVDSPPLGYPVMGPTMEVMRGYISQHKTQPPLPLFSKGVRCKGKRAYPTVPNQPSEASAYFTFELAKTVVTKAGGNSSTSLFRQPSSSQSHHGPHRALQICAFQIGLYALGLHNSVSPNWLSRTYSSHVAWISCQATEIGAPAVSFLIDTWEGHLTPQEAASIADKASRGGDANTIKQAALLALSCLPHSHALNPNEIQRAILQCKEQSDEMLEKACRSVQETAKDGTVFPQIFFFVARCWYDLHLSRSQSHRYSVSRSGQEAHPEPLNNHPEVTVAQFSAIDNSAQQQQQQLSSSAAFPAYNQLATSSAVTIGVSPSLPANSSVHGYSLTPASPSVPYNLQGIPYPLSYSCLPGLATGIQCITPSVPIQMYIQPPAVTFSSSQSGISSSILPQSLYYPSVTIPSTLAQSNAVGSVHSTQPGLSQASSSQHPTAVIQTSGQSQQGFFSVPFHGAIGSSGFLSSSPGQTTALIPYIRQPGTALVRPGTPERQVALPNPPASQAQRQVRSPLVAHQGGNNCSMEYLLNAYQVGMLAMETLARRAQDDRPQTKYTRNQHYAEDVKWLLSVAKELGTQYLHQFCMCSVNSIVSPFVLYDLAKDVAQFLSRNSPATYPQQLRSPSVHPLVQKCQHMFFHLAHLKMQYIQPADYDEFETVMRAAQQAFQMTPGGMVQYNELLQSLRRYKSCKKELWHRIMQHSSGV